MHPESTPPPLIPQVPPPYGYIVTPDGQWRERHISKQGYVYFRIRKKMIYEHRWLWEQWHGPIPEGCVVHHRQQTFNGRSRNTRDNLSLMTIGEHVALHHQVWPEQCSVEDCAAKSKARGLCRKHYWDAYHDSHKDDPEYKALGNAKSKRWREADPERTRTHDKRHNAKRYTEHRDKHLERCRARYHAKMQDPEWREKERLRAAAKNARVAAKKKAAAREEPQAALSLDFE